jgi:hypothetical protein
MQQAQLTGPIFTLEAGISNANFSFDKSTDIINIGINYCIIIECRSR